MSQSSQGGGGELLGIAAPGGDTVLGNARRTVVNVAEQLDANRLQGLPLILAALLSLVLAADGFDLLVLGFVAPAVGHEFGLSRVGIGWLTTFSHCGVALGGILGGLCGDRFGRRMTLLSGVALFGAFAILCAGGASLGFFALARFVSSVGLGVVTPNVAAYLTEILPFRLRSRLTILTFTVSSLGATLCGIAARAYFPPSAWRGLFEIGGIFPLVLLPVLWYFLPESPHYLLTVGGRNAELAKALTHLISNGHFDSSEHFISGRAAAQRVSPRALFNKAFIRETLALWVLAFAVMFSGISITSMGTVILTSAGVSIQTAVSALLAFNIVGVLGALAASTVIIRLGSRTTLSILVLTGIAGLLGLAAAVHVGEATTAVISLMGISGAGLSGALIIAYPVIAQAYPASIRSTGTGAALTFGRVGAILSAITVATLLTLGGPAMTLVAVACIAALALVGVALGRDHIGKGQSRAN